MAAPLFTENACIVPAVRAVTPTWVPARLRLRDSTFSRTGEKLPSLWIEGFKSFSAVTRPSHRLPSWGALHPMQALAMPQDFSSEQQQKEQSDQQLKDLLRGGQDVVDIMAQMANLLEDIQGFEDREEALAVEMAAAAAVAGRLDVLDRSFLLALDMMVQEASTQQDSQQVWLLQTLKQQVLFQLESRFPPQVEVVSILVTTGDKETRLSLLRRAVAASAVGANKSSPATSSSSSTSMDQAAPTVQDAERSPPSAEGEDAPSSSPQPPVRPWPDARGKMAGRAGIVDTGAAAVWIEEQASDKKKPVEIDDGTGRVHRRVPAASLQSIIAQADDLIAFMEEDLPVRDRRLLSRLVLAREEARGMMAGGYEDPRNDVRRLQNLPEAEVRFISQLVAIKNQQQLREKIFEVLQGQGEGEYKETTIKNTAEAMPWGAPVRPGHFMDAISKVITGVYKTGGSGILVQQLENIRKVSLQVLEEIGHGQ